MAGVLRVPALRRLVSRSLECACPAAVGPIHPKSRPLAVERRPVWRTRSVGESWERLDRLAARREEACGRGDVDVRDEIAGVLGGATQGCFPME